MAQQYECWTSWTSRRRQPREDHLSLCSKVSLNEHCVTQCDGTYCAYTCPESVNPLLKAFCQNECNAWIDTSCSANTRQCILCQHFIQTVCPMQGILKQKWMKTAQTICRRRCWRGQTDCGWSLCWCWKKKVSVKKGLVLYCFEN